MGTKILNTSFVCREDGVEVCESVCPIRGGLCTISCTINCTGWSCQPGFGILCTKFFPSLCLQQSLLRSWNAGSFAVCCCLFWDPKFELMERALTRLAAPQSWGINAQPPLLGSAWQFWVPAAEFLLQGTPEFQSWVPPAAECAVQHTLCSPCSPWKSWLKHFLLESFKFHVQLCDVCEMRALMSQWNDSDVTNGTWEALPFWDILHQFHWILQILNLTDEVLI